MKPPPKAATIVYVQRYDIRPGRIRVPGSRRKTVGVYPADPSLVELLRADRLKHGPGRYRLEYRDEQRKLLAVRMLNVGDEAARFKPRSTPRGLPMKVTPLPPLQPPQAPAAPPRPAPPPQPSPNPPRALPAPPRPTSQPSTPRPVAPSPTTAPTKPAAPVWPAPVIPTQALPPTQFHLLREDGRWITWNTERNGIPESHRALQAHDGRWCLVPHGRYAGYVKTTTKDGLVCYRPVPRK